jgi:asparagine synthase (glutamine-hydrolysing)
MPGTYVEVTEKGYVETKWWDLKNQQINYSKDRSDWKSEFNSLLYDVTKIRLVSDVPFGAFLSGGVDSTSIVGIMADYLNHPVKTYSIGFEDKRFDETSFALQAAKRFKTDHHSKIVEHDIVSEWEKFIYHTDQPHGDVSFMPMRKVSELAVRDVKMVLTGDGADELFAGYEKHVPFLSRTDIGDLSADEFTAGYIPYLTLLDSDQCKILWRDEFHDKIDWELVDRDIAEQVADVAHFDPINKGLYLDMHFLLVGNNLVKPDRMGMAVSLETRAPFLDYRMMEFAFQMPGEFKLKDGDKKHLYKEAVSPLIGEALAYRKKQMFTVPIGDWLRGDLAEFCKETLLSDTSCVAALFKGSVMRDLVRNHLAGIQNNTREIRALISIEFWMRQFL